MNAYPAGEREPRQNPPPVLLDAVRNRLRDLAVQVDEDRWQTIPKGKEAAIAEAGEKNPQDHPPLSLPEAVRDRVREIAARIGEDRRSLDEARLAREAELERLQAENARLRKELELKEAGWREERARLEDGYRASLQSLEASRDEHTNAALDELERLMVKVRQMGGPRP